MENGKYEYFRSNGWIYVCFAADGHVIARVDDTPRGVEFVNDLKAKEEARHGVG